MIDFEQAKKNREEIISLLSSVDRTGMDNLIKYLAETDFFVGPASTKYHGDYKGGLAAHSLEVYKNMFKLAPQYEAVSSIDKDSIKIVGLLHDICKIGLYKYVTKSLPKKDDNGDLVLDDRGQKIWETIPGWELNDPFPIGHGEKSVMMILRYISLTDEEIMAINWHMAGFDDRPKQYKGYLACSAAMEKYPIITLVHTADLIASFFTKI